MRVARKGLWGVTWVIAGTLGLATLALLVLRLYYHDERLRQMGQAWLGERLQTHVAIGGLSLSIWSGLEIEEVQVGALPGFTHDTLAFDRLALRWSP
ncbi:MAG: hypothetical protein HYZ27_04650, partial [Deltaproteobacteria bacterium]|nr:hypothetical protein [Deltaproteobacteria bacterium]